MMAREKKHEKKEKKRWQEVDVVGEAAMVLVEVGGGRVAFKNSQNYTFDPLS